jgi:hypothetical protein
MAGTDRPHQIRLGNQVMPGAIGITRPEPRPWTRTTQLVEVIMMFLDCPAYLDEDGALRCGLPAEVRRRFTMCSCDGPLEAAMIRCPSGHWFTGPIESLTWESEEKHPGEPRDEIARPNAAPAYYLGRPARMWITAMSSRGRRKPVADAQNPAGGEQPPNPAREPSHARA